MAKDANKISKASAPQTLLSRRRPKIHLGASPILSSSPPVRIVGSARRYRGGYCLSD
jgi:hypothetical protein